MFRFWWLTGFSFFAFAANAQQPDTPALSFSAYAEVYYLFDFNKPADNLRPAFIYNHNRHNEVNLNLGYLKAAYAGPNLRANLALMAGTYPNANLAAEPGVLKNIFEANIGVRLHRSRQLWLDAGILNAHIGFESAISKDCWTLTRSMLAENSPYYETGVKLGYQSNNGIWLISGLILNGWQKIQRMEGNSLPAFGTQIQFRPRPNLLFNYSTFIGSDTPDSTRRMRYFQNAYAQLQATEKMGIILGLDWGMQQQRPGSSKLHHWFSPVAIVRQALNQHLTLAGRLEYYQDLNGVIIPTGTTHGFKTWGASVNVDVALHRQAVWRTEVKYYLSKDAIFLKQGNGMVPRNAMAATSIAISF